MNAEQIEALASAQMQQSFGQMRHQPTIQAFWRDFVINVQHNSNHMQLTRRNVLERLCGGLEIVILDLEFQLAHSGWQVEE